MIPAEGVPWWKKVPCWLGKHDDQPWDERLTDGRVNSYETCKYCGRTQWTWKNYE